MEEGGFEGASIWTAGGAGCGIDMMIRYARERFDGGLVELSCEGLEFGNGVGGGGQFYGEGKGRGKEE